MLQKCAILGLALLLAGGLAYGWLYKETQAEQQVPNAGFNYSLGPEEYLAKYGRWYRLTPEQQTQLVLELDQDRRNKTPEQVASEQQARLHADLDKLAAGQMRPGEIADFLYGHGWQEEVEQYKQRKEKAEIVQTVSTVCLAIGGTLFGLCAVIGALWGFLRLLRHLRHRAEPAEPEPGPQTPELADIDAQPPAPLENPEPPPTERPKLRRRVLSLTETGGGDTGGSEAVPREPTGVELLTSAFGQQTTAGPRSLAAQAEAQDSAVAVLLTDEQSQEQEWSAESQWSAQAALGAACEEPSAPSSILDPPMAEAQPEAPVVENPLKEQADDLQRQIAEFKQMAQDVQQSTRQHSEPLSSTLKELAEQVSAIREYAACQQGRVEKLQDGYDWGIIRSFCLRVIRCLDNLETRMGSLEDGDETVRHLEEVRDELLFALESSGIEQYRPELHSDYRGQEKLAETLKEREPTEKPEQAGRIAKVIRPGYRYMIDDENYKVVRTAQVKLFG